MQILRQTKKPILKAYLGCAYASAFCIVVFFEETILSQFYLKALLIRQSTFRKLSKQA